MKKVIFLFLFVISTNVLAEKISTAEIKPTETSKKLERNNIIEFQAGATDFTGNKGAAYTGDSPMIGLSYKYRFSEGLFIGANYQRSEHFFMIDYPTMGFDPNPPGLITIANQKFALITEFHPLSSYFEALSPFIGAELGYWTSENEFRDQPSLASTSSGGIGYGLKVGLDWKFNEKAHVGLGLDYDFINYSDKYTQDYRSLVQGGEGFDNLSGDSYTASVRMGFYL